MILGFDPGNSGAWAMLSRDGWLMGYGRLPLRKHGKRKVVDAKQLALDLLKFAPQASHAVVEEVHAMPKQGVSSMFTFGRSLGVVEGLLGSWNLQPVYLRPKAWQAEFLDGGGYADRKALLVEIAIDTWPELEMPLAVKAAWGIADAALIAEAFRRNRGQA